MAHYRCQRIPTLRIYGWSQPCISLGYKQNPRDFLDEACPFTFVRRMTGGAAILHDKKEVTYSLICAYTDLGLPPAVKAGYRRLCSFLKDFYRRCGLKAVFAYEIISDNLSAYGDVCFANWHEFDMVVEGKKIGGNAQRRQKDIIFQQGSIPQQIDISVMRRFFRHYDNSLSKVAALDGLLGRNTDFSSLQHMLAESFSHCFGVKLQRGFLSEQEQKTAQLLLNSKYSQRSWNLEKVQSRQ